MTAKLSPGAVFVCWEERENWRRTAEKKIPVMPVTTRTTAVMTIPNSCFFFKFFTSLRQKPKIAFSYYTTELEKNKPPDCKSVRRRI
ncbi:MAG TPA: hypothetical protein H9896_05205 [Candidatus Pygmaiobacter gallistercoris]|nr:hypothetical protein [Candidatus Pygmaiobacter gallistercoris]